MATLKITLPDDRIAFLREQAEANGSSVDVYLESLVHEQQMRAAKQRLEALLIEGIESGPGRPLTPETWEEIRLEARRRLEAKRREEEIEGRPAARRRG